MCKEYNGRSDSTDGNSHHGESEVSEKESAEETEKSQPPPRQSQRFSRTPPRFNDTVKLTTEDPVAYKEDIIGREKNNWKLSLKEELNFIKKNNNWNHIALLQDKDAIPCKMVLKQKLDEWGRNDCYEKCFVAMCFVQKNSIDYNETAAPVIPFDVFLRFVGKLKSVSWHLHHTDVSLAFLDRDNEGRLFLQEDNKCEVLQKSLYGFKQSLHLWNEKMKNTLEKCRYRLLDSPQAFLYLKIPQTKWSSLITGTTRQYWIPSTVK